MDCGASRLLVVDIDREGILPSELLGETLTNITRPGRRQLWYQQPDGITLGNSTGDLPTGFGDIRGEGGYVVAPPSPHPLGHQYSFIDPTAPIAPLPDSIAEQLRTAGSRQSAALPKEQTKFLDRYCDCRDPAAFERILS